MKLHAFSQNTVWLFCWLNYRDQLLLTQKLTKQLFTVTVTCYLATPAFNNQAINELRDLHKVQSLGSQVPYPRHISRIPSVHKTQPNIFLAPTSGLLCKIRQNSYMPLNPSQTPLSSPIPGWDWWDNQGKPGTRFTSHEIFVGTPTKNKSWTLLLLHE